MDFAPVQLPDIAEESGLVPRKEADLIKEDMQEVIAMANESVTDQDIKSVKELRIWHDEEHDWLLESEHDIWHDEELWLHESEHVIWHEEEPEENDADIFEAD